MRVVRPSVCAGSFLQVHLAAGGGTENAKGLFWVLDEEVRVQGSSDSVVLERLCAAFEKKEAETEGKWMVSSPDVGGFCPCQ